LTLQDYLVELEARSLDEDALFAQTDKARSRLLTDRERSDYEALPPGDEETGLGIKQLRAKADAKAVLDAMEEEATAKEELAGTLQVTPL